MNAEPVIARPRGRRAPGQPTRHRTWRQAVGVGVAVAAALVTSACAAGQQAQTAYEHPSLDGTNIDVGQLHLRGILVQGPNGTASHFPAGSNAELKLVIVNVGSQDDRLTSITSPAFRDWGAFASKTQAGQAIAARSAGAAGGTAGSTTAPAPATSASTSSTSSSSSSSSSGTPHRRSARSSASASPHAAHTPHQQPTPTPSRSILITANNRVSWGTPDATGSLVLFDLTRTIYPASTIRIRFQFQNAGSVTVPVPVALAPETTLSTIPAPTTTSLEG